MKTPEEWVSILSKKPEIDPKDIKAIQREAVIWGIKRVGQIMGLLTSCDKE